MMGRFVFITDFDSFLEEIVQGFITKTCVVDMMISIQFLPAYWTKSIKIRIVSIHTKNVE